MLPFDRKRSDEIASPAEGPAISLTNQVQYDPNTQSEPSLDGSGNDFIDKAAVGL